MRGKFNLYNLSNGKVSPGWFTKSFWRGGRGRIAADIEGQIYQGEYAGVAKGAVGFGSIIGRAGSTTGTALAVSASGDGIAVLTDPAGDVMDCEFSVSGLTGHGYGGCKQKDGTLYRLIF
jgi:hypothetical protein